MPQFRAASNGSFGVGGCSVGQEQWVRHVAAAPFAFIAKSCIGESRLAVIVDGEIEYRGERAALGRRLSDESASHIGPSCTSEDVSAAGHSRPAPWLAMELEILWHGFMAPLRESTNRSETFRRGVLTRSELSTLVVGSRQQRWETAGRKIQTDTLPIAAAAVQFETILLTSFPEGQSMANFKSLASLVSQLKTERTKLVNQLRHMDETLSILGKLNGGRSATQSRRPLSASARRKISAAQKARWSKRGNAQSASAKPVMSIAARRKIAAAQRERWKLWRANHKKAA